MSKNVKTKTRIFIDMDGVLAKWKQAANVKDLYEKGYFAELEPQSWFIVIVLLFIYLNNDDYEIYILSSVLPTKYAIPEKSEWLDREFPISLENRIWVKDGDNKAICVPGGIRKTDILIDDYSLNLQRWEQSGGIGIKLMNGINGTKGSWKGLAVPYGAKYNDFLRVIKKAIG